MAARHAHPDADSYAAAVPTSRETALSSAPRSDHRPPPPPRWHQDESPSTAAGGGQRLRLMCSFGGRILPRPHDRQLRYVGGETRIVAIPRHTTWPSLLSKLSNLPSVSSPESPPPAVKYQLPNEDLDALVSLTSEEDLDNMMDEYDRLVVLHHPSCPPRLRLFLFPSGAGSVSSAVVLGSLLESSGAKRESWFLDVINGGNSAIPPPLERGRSEVSSVNSEVPDYLFGLDSSNSDDPKPKSTDPGSPSVGTSSPEFHSISSPPSVPPIPDLPPAKTKLETLPEPPFHPIPNQVYYVHEPVPVYYLPGNAPVGPLPLTVPYGPVYRQPVHVGGPVIARARMSGSYDYPGGLVYPTAGVALAGEEGVGPSGIAGQEMRIGP